MKNLTGILIVLMICILLPGLAWSSTEIEAQVVRNQSGSGECLISSGFPLPEGLVTEDMIVEGTIKVIVSGEEVAANISALRGRHYDDTIRSILIQFQYSLAENDTLPAKVIISAEPRKSADPDYIRPTLETVKNNNVIFPVGSEYLVPTDIYMRNLLPVGEGSSLEEMLYTELAEDRFDALADNENWGTSDYENVSAKIGMWARFGGDIKFWNEALKETLRWLDYNTPKYDLDECPAAEVANPDQRDVSHGHCGVPAEWHFSRVYSYAQMYLLTGYRDFWGIVAHLAQRQNRYIASKADALSAIPVTSEYDQPRYNYADRYGALIPALSIDATIPVRGKWWESDIQDWKQQAGWLLEALLENKWDLKWIPFENGSGDIPERGSIIEQSDVSAELLGVFTQKFSPPSSEEMPDKGFIQIRASSIEGGSFGVGDLSGIGAEAVGAEESEYRNGKIGTRSWTARPEPNPNFQTLFPATFLINYYLYVEVDERIPNVVKQQLDMVLNNSRKQIETDRNYGQDGGYWGDPVYGNVYFQKNPVSLEDEARSWELPMYVRMLAFVLKTLGDDEVNGATYSEWYKRFIDTANVSPQNVLTWQWKIFGQFYGWNQDTPWMMTQDSLVDFGPAEMRVPVQYNEIPGDTPDIYRSETIQPPELKDTETSS